MEYSIGLASVLAIAFDVLLGFILPFGLLLFFRKKFKCRWEPFLFGVVVMFITTFLLKQLLYVLLNSCGAMRFIDNSVWLTALYNGFSAALLEELGRYIVFIRFMKIYHNDPHHALMYGAGHSSLETIFVLAFGMVSNLGVAVMVYTGNVESLFAGMEGEALLESQQAVLSLTQTPASSLLLVGLERISITLAQIALSVIVWFAALKGRQGYSLLALAFGAHFILEASVPLLNSRTSSIPVLEGVVLLLALLIAFVARLVWKREEPALRETE